MSTSCSGCTCSECVMTLQIALNWDLLIPLPWPLFAHADEGKLLVICIQITPPCAYHLDKLILEPNKNPRCSSHQPNIRYVPIPNNSKGIHAISTTGTGWSILVPQSRSEWQHSLCRVLLLRGGSLGLAANRHSTNWSPAPWCHGKPHLQCHGWSNWDFKNRNKNWSHRDGASMRSTIGGHNQEHRRIIKHVRNKDVSCKSHSPPAAVSAVIGWRQRRLLDMLKALHRWAIWTSSLPPA